MNKLGTTVLFLLCLTLLPAGGVSRARKPATPSGPGLRYLESSFATYDSLQKAIHAYAETGYQEFQSAEALCRHLEAHGFTVERGVAGIPTAFIASFGSGRPVIGLMAEYDALPGMAQDTVPFRSVPECGGNGHGCGHNLLGTGSVAAAVAISQYLSQGHVGTVRIFGCPAEEGGGGKAYMTREGCFEGLDAMLDWHPDTQVTVNDKSGLANVQVRFCFKGISAHASGAPEKGRSALDAVEAFDHMMNLMREHVPASTRIHYVITDGGKAPNVVPDRAEVLYYFRSPQRTVVEEILQRALKAAEGAALGTGTTLEYEIMSGNYERLPNQTLSDMIYQNLLKVGGLSLDERELAFAREMMAASGVDDPEAALQRIRTVVPPADDSPFATVSSDVGNVTWSVPTGSFRMAAFVPAGSGHCWQQVSSGGTTIGTKGALAAAKVLYLTAVDLYSRPDGLRAVQAEFQERRGPDYQFKPLMGDREPPIPGKQVEPRTRMLTPALLDRLAAQAADVPQRAGERFLTQELRKASLDSALAASFDTACTYFVPSVGITDQDESGRCWLFSTLNILRAEMIARYDMGPFQFSQTFGQFYDLLEKSNRCLECIIDHRGEPMDSRWNTWIFNKPIGDGGHFSNAAHIIAKYGMVPQEVMPERFSSTDNYSLMKMVNQLLRRYGLLLRDAKPQELEAVKEKALSDIYRLLVATLGEPPRSFDWTLRDRNGRILSTAHYTPESFRDAFILHDMERDYAIFMDDPTLPYYKMYEVAESRNCYEYASWRFLNVPMDDIRRMGVASLAGGRRFYISADTMHDYLMTEGIYDTHLFPLDSLIGMESRMTKEELVRSAETRSVHAVAVAGVQLDAAGEPVKWVIENSYGLVRGWGGYVVASDPWMCQYLYRLVVEKRFVEPRLLELFETPVEMLPAWYPNY